MERKVVNGLNHIIGYHTQEFRQSAALEEPIPCHRTNAWLGVGYYYWTDLEFAKYWGIDAKIPNSPTGCYDIYNSYIKEDNLLNTVFNQEHYEFFIEKIDLTIKKLKSSGISSQLSLKNVNRYLADNVWLPAEIAGIIFEDIPQNNRVSEIPPLYYMKRIQIVVFNKVIISNFDLLLEEQS